MTKARGGDRDEALSDNVEPINPSILKNQTDSQIPEPSKPLLSKNNERVDQKHSRVNEYEEIRLSTLILDVKRMAVFAAEKGTLPSDISLGEIYNIWYAKQQGYIKPAMINTISDYYLKLEDALGEVTAFSLKATRCHNIDDCMDSDAGRYVKKLIWLVLAVVIVIVTTYLYGYYYERYIFPNIASDSVQMTWQFHALELLHHLGQYLIPFTFGTLGALAFILRFSVGRLHKREFDPRRIPGNYIRIVLGSISGGAIVMFINNQTTPTSIGIEVTAAALGFLAGYSTDFLFNIIDRLKGSLDSVSRSEKILQNEEQKQIISVETKAPKKNKQGRRKRNHKQYN